MVLINDFKSEPNELKLATQTAVNRVINSGWYILGKEVESFERVWSASCNTKFSVGVGNGMDAIEIALRAMGIGPGDEVITSSMTAFATVLAIIRSGAIPVLADIDLRTALLSISSVERCITKKTKAVVLVHLYGQVRQMCAWQEFCELNKIHLIEDCAQSHLAKSQGVFAGGFGKVGAFSFYPTKNLGAYGDAGAIVTNNFELSEKAKRLRNYGQSDRYYHPDLGMNSRLDEIQAAILTERLKWLPQFNKERQKIAITYNHNIRNDAINLMAEPEEESAHIYHLYVVLSNKRDSLIQHLALCGIQSLIHYPIPVHLQASCSGIKIDPKGLKVSETHARKCLSIPCHPQMTQKDVSTVIQAINSFE